MTQPSSSGSMLKNLAGNVFNRSVQAISQYINTANGNNNTVTGNGSNTNPRTTTTANEGAPRTSSITSAPVSDIIANLKTTAKKVAINEPPILIVDEVSERTSKARKIAANRAAFKRLVKTLKWHESKKGRGFKFVNYENFRKKYPEEFKTLTSIGMNFANLGVFLHDFLTNDPASEEFGLRETPPTYYSDWFVVLVKFRNELDEEIEPTLDELESTDDSGSEDDENGVNQESSEEEEANLTNMSSFPSRSESIRTKALQTTEAIKQDFMEHNWKNSGRPKGLSSTLLDLPNNPTKVGGTFTKLRDNGKPRTEITKTPKQPRKKLEVEETLSEASSEETVGVETTNTIPYPADQSSTLMTALIEAFQLNTNLDGLIEPLKNGIRDPAEWFAHYDMITGARNWTPEVKVRMLRLKLKGSAARVFRSLTTEEKTNYNLVRKRICE